MTDENGNSDDSKAQPANDQADKPERVEAEVVEAAANLPARLVDELPTNLPILVSPLGPVFPGMRRRTRERAGSAPPGPL